MPAPVIYTVYETKNQLTNMIYVGVHKTRNPDDDYLGSGIYIRRAIAELGEKHFQKTVLFEYDNPVDAFLKELEIVNEEFVKRPDTYNLCIGGRGGQGHMVTDPPLKQVFQNIEDDWCDDMSLMEKKIVIAKNMIDIYSRIDKTEYTFLEYITRIRDIVTAL